MAIYLKKFSTHQEYDAYINGSGAILPNVSICTTEGDVHYNPSTPPTPVETRLVCKFNVTDISNPTRILGEYYSEGFDAIEIDGVEQAEIITAYTFSTTGEHTVKYTLTDPTIIDTDALEYCDSLTSVIIPSGVTYISVGCFNGCIELTSVNIPNGVISIGGNAFSNCSLLTNINIPNSIESIGGNAFCNCISLDAATVATIEAIDEYAFSCD